MGWKEEFPDFDGGASCVRLVADGWDDVSRHNDTCPSFEKGGVVIWVDYVDRMAREFPDAPHRFGVMYRHNDQTIDGCDTLDGALLSADEAMQELSEEVE